MTGSSRSWPGISGWTDLGHAPEAQCQFHALSPNYPEFPSISAHGGFFNISRLSDAQCGRAVSGVTFPAVAVTQRFDFDLAGRLSRERHANVVESERTLAYDYYPTGE